MLKLYSISDVSDISGISTHQLRYLVKKYNISCYKIRDRRYFDKVNISAILQAAHNTYDTTKSPKSFLDKDYLSEQLEKRLDSIKNTIAHIEFQKPIS